MSISVQFRFILWFVTNLHASPPSAASHVPLGFMTYVAEPLFIEWARFSDTCLSQTMLGYMGLNKASWGGLQQEQSSVGEEAEPSVAGVDDAAARRGDGGRGNGSKEIPQGSRGPDCQGVTLSPQPPDAGRRPSPHTGGQVGLHHPPSPT